MNARRIHLKIKIQTLADEARHIRRDERKALAHARNNLHSDREGSAEESAKAYRTYEDLNDHRRGIVREVARTNHLAYGCLKGTPYEKIERICVDPPDWSEVRKVALRFGGDPEKVEAWINAAQEHISGQRRAA
jgi:hypothetical protein